MAIGSSASGITFSGLSSGIDVDGIISRLMTLEAQPIARLQKQQQQLQQQQSVFGQLRSKLQSLSGAAGALNNASAFNPVSATSSDTAVATVTASSGATAGNYTLSVTKLAQAQKLATAAQANTTSSLGQTGTFVVNGKTITVDANDSLKSLATKINSTGAGVTASLIDGGTGSAYLTLTASGTGVSNKIQLADGTGGILASLGVVSGATSIREPITNGATTIAFANNTGTVKSLLGGTSWGASSFTVNGTAVNVDLSTATLQDVANAINASSAGATATVRSVTDASNNTTYKLDIVGTSGTPTLADVSGNALQALGVLQQAPANQLLAAQDAEYKLDGVSLKSGTNTITSAIPGATITLLKANEATPATSTILLSSDTTAVKAKIGGFTQAINDTLDFISTYSQFDKDTFDSGPLFGDPTAEQVEQQITDMLFNDVPGLTGTYKNLAQLGFSMDKDGKVLIDDAKLSEALAADPNAVGELFRTTGLGSTNDLTFVIAGTKTAATVTGAYDVNVTALATKGSYTAELAQTSASTASETLTFSGNLFGGTNYRLTLNVGNTLTDTVNAINSDSKLRDLVVASIDGSGKLLVSSKKFGTGGNFTLVSNITAAANNSGIGVGSLGAKVSGTDIQGTINGEAATGAGQFLTGNSGNAKTDGLQIQYTGTSTGLVGTMKVRKGLGSQLTDLMGQFTDSVSGILTGNDNALKDQVQDISDRIDDLKKLLDQKQLDLRAKFTAMEEAISNIQSQGQRLASLSVKNS